MWFGCGSVRSGYGSDMARVWLGCGSDAVRVWFGCGSGMVWVGPAYIYVLFLQSCHNLLNLISIFNILVGRIEPKHVQYANNLKKLSLFFWSHGVSGVFSGPRIFLQHQIVSLPGFDPASLTLILHTWAPWNGFLGAFQNLQVKRCFVGGLSMV